MLLNFVFQQHATTCAPSFVPYPERPKMFPPDFSSKRIGAAQNYVIHNRGALGCTSD